MTLVDVPLKKLKIYPDFGNENLPDSEYDNNINAETLKEEYFRLRQII